MKVVCAWCGAFLRSVPDASPHGRLQDSHGICESCARTLREELGTPVERFLSELGVPVLLLSSDVRVVDANPAALAMLGGVRETTLGRLGGEVFECANAGLPGGCGRTVHCSGCVLRQTVTSTWQTGRTQTRIPATLEVTSRDAPERIAFLVTTARVGDRVLVRIDPPAADTPGAHNGQDGQNG